MRLSTQSRNRVALRRPSPVSCLASRSHTITAQPERVRMPSFRVVAIPTEVATTVRTTQLSPFSRHPVHTELARGHGPCRHCLRSFVVGAENRMLFTLDPFAGYETLPLPGPVFVHEAECAR